jgi:UDPglucose--hexose-1-phosphate uridylyltransferase
MVVCTEMAARRDPLTGQLSIIVDRRQTRPNQPVDGCPFCPGGIDAPDPYDVRCFANRWPPLPDGRAEVVLFAPEHDVSLASLPRARVQRVVELWAQRTAALGSRDDVAYVLVFENRGAEVGATIAHPHGQIYAFSEVPPAPQAELGAATCALCGQSPGDGLVAQVGEWRAWVPEAAIWPYALLIAPEGHVADLPAAAPSHAALAALLVDVFGRLDRLFGAPMPLMMWRRCCAMRERPASWRRASWGAGCSSTRWGPQLPLPT